MAIQQLQREAWTFLAERDVIPDAAGQYDEDALEEAIRAGGWELTFDGLDGDWVVEIGEQLAPTRFRYASAGDPDRTTALLRALEAWLAWQAGDAMALSPSEHTD